MMYCSDCCFQTDVVLDHATGDAICSNCGLVLDSHCIDETSEWRTFSDENADDRIRVGAATNALLSGGGLSTVMAKPYGEVLRCHIRIKDPDQGLLMAFKTIETMCDSFGLVPSIKARANEMYKALEEQKCSRVLRNQNAVLAACLYIACRQEDKPRTLKEILSVANGTSKKEIGRAKVFITKQLRLVEKPAAGRGQESHSYAGDYMRRFCSALGLTDQAIRAAQEAVHKSYDFDIRRSPVSIAAAVIYIVTQISEDGHKKSLKDIADVTGVAPATIKSSYKDLSPHVSKLIPDWPSSIFVKKCC